MAMSREVREVFEEMLKVLRERGWCHNGPRDRAGRVCLLIAGDTAMRNLGQRRFLSSEPCILLANVLDSSYGYWNDDPSRTFEDVELLLKYAAADELETWKEMYGPA